jgi:hypothetical protein
LRGRAAVLLALGWLALACSGPFPDAPPPEAPPPAPPASLSRPLALAPGLQTPAAADTRPALALDSDGVLMLLPPAPQGSSWSLGGRDPNSEDPRYFDLDGDSATRGEEDGIVYWSNPGHTLRYASGEPDGRTARFNIKASGGTQTYTWQSGAREQGYLSSPQDLRNFEATAYVRVRGATGADTSMSWKLRGGRHSGSDGASASCTGMLVPSGDESPAAYRELNHPHYDHVELAPRFPFRLQEGRWLAVKVVSYLVEGGTRNLLYLDGDPFDAEGRPRNGFRLYTEWDDRDGVPTGQYDQAATWGGWVNTFRVDGWQQVDLAILSAREIIPPAPGEPPPLASPP